MNPTGLRQPDARSCGAACMVVAADLARPGPGAPPADRHDTFAADVLATHRRLTGLRLRGRLQLPWPRALGTPPWAVARELGALTGRRHRTRLVRWSPASAHDHLRTGGVLYVGSTWLPRHVVLAMRGAGPGLRVYEPSRGVVVVVEEAALAAGDVRLAGWERAWFTVAPR